MSTDSEQAVNEWFDNNRDKYPEISSYEYLFKKLASVIYHSRDKEVGELRLRVLIQNSDIKLLYREIEQLKAEIDGVKYGCT